MSDYNFRPWWSGWGRRRRPRKDGESPAPVGGLLDGLLEKWGVAEQVERASVFSEWEERLGERLAEHARPVRLDGGTLFVEVESSSWMMELQMMKRELMERLNAGRERGRIEKLVFVQGGGRPGDEPGG